MATLLKKKIQKKAPSDEFSLKRLFLALIC
ncbi:hypothetical protein DLH98_03775 [Vibrio parahaemolyticus]|nr:hypothetical protein DA442_23890 [Vibrio parahaemolyticus]EGQ8131792.1 hypothetical protein [Vibrio parahaemolyticus]EGQ8281636.1 hypothetical protein [Vibrio parahaemolyticus]EGQ8719592.1 hypothetical protein [Vibrio parahaemolyticus]EGQ8735815.1 hypothetical protein [Vibrio parahaemolyticus]